MNRIYDQYDIRLARYDEIDEIMHFIDTEWKHGHILATNRKFFEYEFVVNNQVNVVIAKDKTKDIIMGMQGFLLTANPNSIHDMWGAIWKVSPKAMPFTGIEIEKYWFNLLPARSAIGVGANPNTSVKLWDRAFHLKTARMHQFYMISNHRKANDYKIAVITHDYSHDEGQTIRAEVKEIADISHLEQDFNFSSVSTQIPIKDAWYINHRFFKHPIYTYHIYGIYVGGDCKAFFVLRFQEYNGSSAVRIIDYIGDQSVLPGAREFFENLLNDNEYIDFYVLGFREDFILKTGFTERILGDTNIIPNYFSPYEARNIDIYCVFPTDGTLCFKGDADQDRPS